MMKNSGFTLVELIVVVVVLGLIALVTVPAVTGVIRGAKKDVKNVNIDTILNAANDYAQKFPEILPNSTVGETSDLVCAEELVICGLLKDDISSSVDGFSNSAFKITYCNGENNSVGCNKDPESGKYFSNYLFTYVENSNKVCNKDEYRCKSSEDSNANN